LGMGAITGSFPHDKVSAANTFAVKRWEIEGNRVKRAGDKLDSPQGTKVHPRGERFNESEGVKRGGGGLGRAALPVVANDLSLARTELSWEVSKPPDSRTGNGREDSWGYP